MEQETKTQEAVKIWRDTFKLNLKPGFKQDVLVTVTDLELWKEILTEWKKRKWNPFKINWMLSEYEQRERRAKKHTERPNATADVQRQSVSERSEVGLSKWRDRSLSEVQKGAGVHARADCQTLDEAIARALRAQNRLED